MLFLDQATEKVEGGVVMVDVHAWAGDWDGEDFSNVREGRTVTLRIKP